jgi:outer membrane protein assembly factor BamD (BamD/ComL family)
MTSLTRVFVTALGVVLLALARGQALTARGQDLPARMLENARGNLRDKRYSDGVRALEQVLAQNPNTSVAADALLELATYHFDISGDLAASQTAAEGLTSTYRQFTNAAAMGWVMKGRILLAQTRQATQMTTALSNFNSVATIYPRSEPVPMAGYFAGEALRITGASKPAIERLRNVVSDYPTSPWAARALISTAICQVADGQHLAAMETLQRVRRRFSGTAEATVALQLNDQLYRLYLRPAAGQPSYEFSEQTIPRGQAKLEDVEALRVDAAGTVFAVAKGRLLAYDRDGTLLPAGAMMSPIGLFLDKDGALIAVQKGALNRGGTPIALRIPKPDGTPRILEDVSAGAAWSTGEYIVADASGLLKFARDGTPLGALSALRAEKLAVNARDEIAAIDREGSIVMVDRDGRSFRTLAKKGATYELKRPTDLTFDPLGHLFVLDRGQSSVFVFNAAGLLVTTFAIPDKTAGAFRKAVALSVDHDGRLYIYDDSAKRVLVYR